MRVVHRLVGMLVLLAGLAEMERDERGLSQSTESAILLAGAVSVAGIVVTLITIYVRDRIPS